MEAAAEVTDVIFKIVVGLMEFMQQAFPERCYMISRDGDHKFRWLEWLAAKEACPYLERVVLKQPGRLPGLFLHRLWANDKAGYHDHPFSAWSLPLAGRFYERRPGRLFQRRAGRPYYINGETFHRLQLGHYDAPGAALTLFIPGRRYKTWGFLTGGEFEVMGGPPW